MSERFFEAIAAGKVPTPECAKTLGLDIIGYDLDAHTVELGFEGRPEFANPIGIVQGGFLSAMLDDCMGLASATLLSVGEFAPTLAINVQFHRPAKIGKLRGAGRVTKQGKDILHLAGELFQDDKLVATATATAMVRKM
ncbi:PaaI family thioesterase [Afipia massiliensis]|uniref:PaaI family thioesterase n=1 Tax=Afipia massiliensis TaxID=211460 RepID=A0A4U6BQ95_9BRAD|nr:PaaI family thioesterase [Afipia massiliensis]MDZ4367956.1 PaaI family thioesterase [Afipia sp.]TKT72602.1 PaaI family thioesterase [Afipia massiliensis]